MAGDQRVVISARIIGAVHRDTPKLKMFMISVLWSDNTEVIIYRSFQEFRKCHRQLKKRFSNMNIFKKNFRVIPKFRGQARKSSQKEGSKRSIQRMKFLESYCEKLLKCDQSVTRTPEVTQFFMPKNHDLQPDFTKNSIMILMSDDLPDGGGGEVSHQPTGSVTHPFVTQTYSCVAAYETKDTKNRPFKVAMGEKLDVLIKDPAGWWLVENDSKGLAWFPAPYLQLLDGEDEEDSVFQNAGDLYCAVRSYTTKQHDEVSVPLGSAVEVLRKSDDGWWLVRFNGKAGYIPSMNLQPYNNTRAGLYSLQRKRHSSTLNPASSREAPDSRRSSDSTGLRSDSAIQFRGHLHKARSLDVLSETRTQMERDAEEARARSMSNTCTDTTISVFKSNLADRGSPLASPRQSDSKIDLSLLDRCGSDTSDERSESASSNVSRTSSVGPQVPARPKTEEILTRCSTMTRKAALTNKTRLHSLPENIHSR
ncbi:NADPH oxidase organizer 1-like [Gymnodraco acuticeps]|uniref:NADPH oxidase organizer 1-like n=1 Tax=Gymnodraco acuticeps TaxID=8218 RepID=A0A6P8SR66_GYMAC|nr:NADPH oxidase organizer 1-like [Gymnodraco acuticeps]